MRVSVFLLLSLVALVVHSDPGASHPPIGTDVGQLYPNYVLPSLADGRPLALSQFRGRKIILHQFASW